MKILARHLMNDPSLYQPIRILLCYACEKYTQHVLVGRNTYICRCGKVIFYYVNENKQFHGIEG
jgi:hypothetical protein